MARLVKDSCDQKNSRKLMVPGERNEGIPVTMRSYAHCGDLDSSVSGGSSAQGQLSPLGHRGSSLYAVQEQYRTVSHLFRLYPVTTPSYLP